MSPELAAKQVAAEIDHLAELAAAEGWDSYDASPIEPAELELAKAYVHTAAREIADVFQPPIVGPTAAPGVALVWRDGAYGGELSAHFSRSGVTFMVLSPDRQRVVHRGSADTPKRFAVDVLKPYLTGK